MYLISLFIVNRWRGRREDMVLFSWHKETENRGLKTEQNNERKAKEKGEEWGVSIRCGQEKS